MGAAEGVPVLPSFRFSGLARLAAPLVALTLLAAPAAAQAPNPPPGPVLTRLSPDQLTALQAVNTYYNSIRTLRGEFIQIGPEESQLSEGVFYMSRPGRVRFEYYPPSQLLIVSNGNLVEVNNPEARTRDQYPLARTPLAALLASNTDLSAEANIRDVVLEDDLIAVVLTQAEDGGWLTLYFDRATYELRQWVTIDPQGYSITFVIYNLAINQSINDDLFQVTERTTPG